VSLRYSHWAEWMQEEGSSARKFVSEYLKARATTVRGLQLGTSSRHPSTLNAAMRLCENLMNRNPWCNAVLLRADGSPLPVGEHRLPEDAQFAAGSLVPAVEPVAWPILSLYLRAMARGAESPAERRRKHDTFRNALIPTSAMEQTGANELHGGASHPSNHKVHVHVEEDVDVDVYRASLSESGMAGSFMEAQARRRSAQGRGASAAEQLLALAEAADWERLSRMVTRSVNSDSGFSVLPGSSYFSKPPVRACHLLWARWAGDPTALESFVRSRSQLELAMCGVSQAARGVGGRALAHSASSGGGNQDPGEHTDATELRAIQTETARVTEMETGMDAMVEAAHVLVR